MNAASIAAAAALIAASPTVAAEVTIRDAIARVVVIPENRSDVSVEIEAGVANLPPLRITREGLDVTIDGDIYQGARQQNWNCPAEDRHSSPTGPELANQIVRVTGRDPVRMSEAPLVTIRTPMNVDMDVGGAVWGAIGRAESVTLEASGCGDWTVANVDGASELIISGSGDIHAGLSRSLEATVRGSGDINAGPTADLEAVVQGSGSINVARVDGPVQADVMGTGDIVVAAGEASKFNARIMGTGDVDFQGRTQNGHVSITGTGDVRVAAGSSIRQSNSGLGELIIGR